jgi:hypothetical protein
VTIYSRTTTIGRDQQVLQGIADELQSIPTLPLGATSFTPASLAAFIQSRIDLANAVVTARAQWRDTVATYDAASALAAVVLRDLRNFIIGAFGPTSPKLAAFGFSPPKQTTWTPEQKAAAAAKRLATRKARKTLGKKQKAKVKGTPATTPIATNPTTPTSTTT